MERKIIFGVMSYDREPYFSSVIRNIYNYAKKIVIVEGYEEVYWSLSNCDWTAKKIKELDKDDRILHKNIGQVSSFSKDPTWHKNEIMQVLIDEMENFADEGDWMIYLGADEIWTQETFDYLLTLPKDIIWVGAPADDFMGDFYHMRVRRTQEDLKRIKEDDLQEKFYDKDGNWMINGLYHERIFRFFKGYNFRTNHTAVKDKEGKYVYAHPNYAPRRIYLPLDSDFKYCHYGYVGEMDWILRKLLYHHRRTARFMDTLKSGGTWFWNEERYRFIFHGWSNPGRVIEIPVNYKHPYPMEEHPYFGKTREEITFGLQSLEKDKPVFDKEYVKFDRNIGYYLDY